MKRKVVVDDSSEDEPIQRKRAKQSPNTPTKESANPLWGMSYTSTPVKSPAKSSQSTPRKSVQNTPSKSIQNTPSKSIQNTPRKSIQNTPRKSIQNTPDSSLLEDDTADKKTPVILNAGEHFHDHTDWMCHPKDKYGHDSNDPNYDPTSILVPPSFLKKATNAMKQWWALKEEALDCVLLMKMGKFYETYHMDADIMVKELDLIYMKGETAHAGFPEAAYSKFSNMLVNRGYRVARIEQTETPQQMKERNKTGGQKVAAAEWREA